MVDQNTPSSSTTRSMSFKARLGIGRGFVACSLRRWSGGSSSSRS
uniref:Uncharacterized protein n=1 Tax=Rhizophora mucronata TaxID=61149 RepID=A0A2P2JFC5_RHIMU